ncbi:MAG: cupin domain-containing protein [Candidatus Lokiarchaeota archaeon]|nr:cupin domain-containing protein [Candidatus Lokiarchaeota archaeon]
MKIIDMNETEVAQTPHQVDVRKLISYKDGSMIHIALEPSESLKMHITPVDVCFYVLEGEGMVEIGKEKETVRKDQLIFSPAKIPHRLSNESETTFRFLVIKTPTPTEETKIL